MIVLRSLKFQTHWTRRTHFEYFNMVRLSKTLASLCSYSRQKSYDLSWKPASSCSLHHMFGAASVDDEGSNFTNWLVVGDGDLSYCSILAEELAGSSTTRLFATVLEEEEIHNRVYKRSKDNSEAIASFSSNRVMFGVDGTDLPRSFPDVKFDVIEFNFPHWKGKSNAKKNRELVNGFLESASSVLKPSGEIRIAFCQGQGGMPSESLDEWRQSWMPATYAANHGLILARLEPFEPSHGLSSYRGKDRAFNTGKSPQRYFFRFPHGDTVPEDVQLSCRHELRVMLHPEKLETSPMSSSEILHGDAVLNLGRDFIPDGFRFEIPARALLEPMPGRDDHVPLAVFLLNYTGESMPLTRLAADQIRDNIEREIINRWELDIAKGGRLVSRPYPFLLMPKLIKMYI